MNLHEFKLKLADMGIDISRQQLIHVIGDKKAIIDIEVDKDQQTVILCAANIQNNLNDIDISMVAYDPERFLKTLKTILK